jgi:hypothetical protein
MSILTVRLNSEEENKLNQLLASMHLHEKSALIKLLINNQWLSTQSGKTFLERRGGAPKYFVSESKDSSSRTKRKETFAAHVEQKAAARRKVSN